jgi:L-ascorbate metabolism protein UlaG (beta-lactamase superfamily)
MLAMKRVALLFALNVLLCAQGARQTDEIATAAGPVRITPIYHASLVLEGGGQVIYVDPWEHGNYDGLPPANLVLITHEHGDHLDPRMIARLRRDGTIVAGPEAVAQKLNGVALIRIGEEKTLDKWSVLAVPAYNIKRGPSEGGVYHEKGRGVGYVLTFGGKRIYISGDTEAVPEMKALKNIDVAFVSMNLPYTMTPAEAAEAIRAFRPKIVYPYHYRGSDLTVLQKALEGTGIDVRIRNWYKSSR